MFQTTCMLDQLETRNPLVQVIVHTKNNYRDIDKEKNTSIFLNHSAHHVLAA